MEFRSAYRQGFVRVAAATIPVTVADPHRNLAELTQQIDRCHEQSVAVVVFPEMSLTGYAIDDLVLAEPLLEAVDTALRQLVAHSQDRLPVVVVGAPLRFGHRLLNTAVVLHRGRVLGVVPKSYLPTYGEFYERRWYASGSGIRDVMTVAGQEVPIGADLQFAATDVPDLRLHVEICEDMFVPVPPSAVAALAGATVLANCSGSPITIGRADDRHLLAQSASARGIAGYVYAAAGPGESTTDLAWDGQTMIYETGQLLTEGPRFSYEPVLTIADIDLERIRQDRIRVGSFDDNRRALDLPAPRVVDFALQPPLGDIGLRRDVARFPFVPADPQRLAQDCYEAYNIQVNGLIKRLQITGGAKIVIGVSGGLDSTHALLVAADALDQLGRPRTDIIAVTMPGFGTSEATRTSALALMEAVGATASTIDIRPAATLMLTDLGHPFAEGVPQYDVTFENVQAGLRTDYLFRIANQRGAMVLGTGDLSELALGWCTYGVGDQMSHYAVNAGVPKTLIQHLIRWVISENHFDNSANQVLNTILGQEISPELIPAQDGQPQSTEALIGPYSLHDFTLYYLVRYGYSPRKIAFLAWYAWHDVEAGSWPAGWTHQEAYDLPQIRSWLETFIRRFFSNQFKRSALPNGPKVSAGGTLSPRGDWRMPSDASAAVWLRNLEEQVPHSW